MIFFVLVLWKKLCLFLFFQENITLSYLIFRPGPLVEDMLWKKIKITPFMVSSVQPCTSPVFAVQSVSPTSNETNMYIIKFGDKDTISSCECSSFKHGWLLCKHFFAVFESKLGDFDDISPLYINHPCYEH